jgi:hypothetical protein
MNANTCIEFHNRNTPIHNPPSTAPPNLRPPPAHIRIHKLPPQRSDKHPLRPAGQLLCCYPVHVQIPHLALFSLPILLVIHNSTSNVYLGPQHHDNFEGDVLPCTLPARALPVPRLSARSCRRLGGRHGVSQGFVAGRVWVQSAGVDGRAGGG